MRSRSALLLPLATAAALIALWDLAVRSSGGTVFPSPYAVVAALVELARHGALAPAVGRSLLRVGSGYALALLVGIPLGMLMGWSVAAARALNPVVQVLRPISPIAWIPVAIVLFKVGDGAAVFLIFLAALFPIAVATMNGVRSLPPIVLLAGRNFGLSPAGVLARVVFPAALPQVLVGLRIALGVAWLVVVAAEMSGIESGLGYLIIDARNAGKRYDLVVAAMAVIGVIGLSLDLLARRVERLPAVRWGFRKD
ncbi:MAG TPA: ABC transporter permease [Thermoanaerobaculia bacterium]|nr:ABC transporter permease [Thermoanaerobaculia bacterium]